MRKFLFLSLLSCAAMFFLNSCCGEGRINGTKIQEGNNLVGLITDTETGKGIAGVAVSDGYTHFICGFAAGADLMFAEIVAELKIGYSLILEVAIPYPGRMNTRDETFQCLIPCCDVVNIHSNYYFGGCYMKRNRYMVDHSSRVIAVYDGRTTGGTATTLQYAEQVNCQIRKICFEAP